MSKLSKFRVSKNAASKKYAVAALAMAGALTISACSGPANATNPTPSPSVASEVASPSSEPKVTEASKPVGKTIQTPNGPYVQAELPANYPNYAPNPAIVDKNVSGYYTPEEVQSAKKFVMDFIATEGINSKANGGIQTMEQWLIENKNSLSPDWYSSLLEDAKNDKQIVLAGKFEDANAKFRYVYGENKTRQTQVSVKPSRIWAHSNTSPSGKYSVGLAITSDVSFVSDLLDASDKPVTSPASGTMTYSVEKDGKGGWLINGYEHDIH
jgi:type IV secretory pathway VirB10-like protein